jgi:hypothetical protein
MNCHIYRQASQGASCRAHRQKRLPDSMKQGPKAPSCRQSRSNCPSEVSVSISKTNKEQAARIEELEKENDPVD